MASEVRDHAADHDLESEAAGLLRKQQRLGQAARFVELDIHRVVAVGERCERSPVMHQLVGADRDGSLDARQNIIAAGGEGLLDQLHADSRGCGKKRFDIIGLPGLVGIDDEPRSRDGRPHRGEPVRVPVAAQLEL